MVVVVAAAAVTMQYAGQCISVGCGRIEKANELTALQLAGVDCQLKVLSVFHDYYYIHHMNAVMYDGEHIYNSSGQALTTVDLQREKMWLATDEQTFEEISQGIPLFEYAGDE